MAEAAEDRFPNGEIVRTNTVSRVFGASIGRTEGPCSVRAIRLDQ